MPHDPTTRTLDIAKFLDLDDGTLCVLFGQYIAKNICNAPMTATLPGRCSLHSVNHYAPDDTYGRPNPIDSVDDFLSALGAARRHFASARLLVQTTVTLDTGVWSVSLQMIAGQDDVRTETWIIGTHSDAGERTRAIQRATIVSLLRLADAPTTPMTIDEAPTLVDTEIRELHKLAASEPESVL